MKEFEVRIKVFFGGLKLPKQGTKRCCGEVIEFYLFYLLTEFANAYRLQQDHPCVIELIRKFYLHQPAPMNSSLNLSNPSILDPSSGQSNVILTHLKNQVCFEKVTHLLINETAAFWHRLGYFREKQIKYEHETKQVQKYY
jgi:hypothetical protein